MVHLSTGALLLCLALSPLARAGQLNPADVPSDAQWVIHIDVDGARKSTMWEIVDQRLKDNDEFQAGIGQIEQFTGLTFPRDLHELTIFSSTFDDKELVIVIGADFDQNKILQALPHAQNFAKEAHGKFDIMSWEDKGKQVNGAFFSPTRVLIGQSKDAIAKALDVMSGQAAGQKEDSTLATAAKGANALGYVAGKGLGDLMRKNDPKNPLVGQVDAAAIALAEKDNQAMLTGTFTAKDAKTAEQLRTSLEGLKAMAALLANGENADARLKTIAPMLQTVKVAASGTTVDVQWALPMAQVKALVEMGPATRPARR